MVKNQERKSSENIQDLRRQASEYAMAFDLLSRVASADSEESAIEGILEVFEILFSPQKVLFVSLKDKKAHWCPVKNQIISIGYDR